MVPVIPVLWWGWLAEGAGFRQTALHQMGQPVFSSQSLATAPCRHAAATETEVLPVDGVEIGVVGQPLNNAC